MNIQQAMEQLRGAVVAYLSKDERGMYRIPYHMQRPIIMLGPPGVGKTAIVSQVAEELGVNYVSYSITHHTRQTALGLPYIVERTYGGRTYQVSEYTMSEIIGAVQEARERSGVAEGILFLDEVNCVSETLAPAMLQFLQYKTFGQHALPAGWVIVTAGNPPEYNRAARELDPALMDRMKCMHVEPDVGVWLDYAASHGVHPAILDYLAAKPEDFYRVRAGVSGMRLVTARGWEDLSRMLLAYEAEGLAVDEDLVAQYLQDEETFRDFTVHYQLFCKRRDVYRIADILSEGAAGAAVENAGGAPFDERMTVVSLLEDAVSLRVRDVESLEAALVDVRHDIVRAGGALKANDVSVLDGRIAALLDPDATGNASERAMAHAAACRRILGDVRQAAALEIAQGGNGYEAARTAFNAECARHRANGAAAEAAMDNAYAFIDAAYGPKSQEGIVFTTRLSASPQVISFVAHREVASYLAHNKGLLVEKRKRELLEELGELGDEGMR